MKSARILPLLATAITSPVPIAALNWSFDSKRATCDGDPFSNVYIDATCIVQSDCQSGSTCTRKSKCGLGDTPEITGRLTATTAFPDNQVVVKPCMSGICPKRDAKVDGRLCDWLLPISGQACGEAGDYQFDYSVKLPEEDSGLPGWMLDHALTIKVQVVEGDTDCSTGEEEEEESEGYELPYPLMGLGALAGIAVAACRERSKRRKEDRRVAEEDHAEEGYDDDDEETYQSFDEESYVEMSKRVSSRNCPEEDAVPRVISSRRKSGRQSPLEQYKPPALGQSPDRKSGSGERSPPPMQEVSLEVLREWYEQHGIAIV